MKIRIPLTPDPVWPDVIKITIEENQEPLVPVSLAPAPLQVYPAYYKMGIPNSVPECHVRTGVYQRLLQAAQALPAGISLLLLDSWRPYAVQQYLYDTLYDALETRLPNKTATELEQMTREFVSLPSTRVDAPSPHLTGGSVDVTLVDRHGLMLDMGTQFDEASVWSHTHAYEEIAAPDARETEVINNRRLLYSVMTLAGFTNLPSEWWHFDFGNQLWAWYSGAERAVYGATQLDSLENRWRREVEKYSVD
ncbi:M15 family metallopeptidase [Oceanisphaera arctica]|uniref:D-alanyl-D-alanine dipeptidase n=1 Tax=Oceanisphaera arctica TaxID=641510 RepID=A0A2P5TMH0_9GAMM|nr:M15 family metallopeptidase [Oceanisphaera arctica]PPL16602.1 D-alanyl-D-alanine dipeptidase [Oceanisphaera arctica]GHA10813.1 D-alanyl-D-alanine dipeptidase [Oceanisphaera arctica]